MHSFGGDEEGGSGQGGEDEREPGDEGEGEDCRYGECRNKQRETDSKLTLLDFAVSSFGETSQRLLIRRDERSRKSKPVERGRDL